MKLIKRSHAWVRRSPPYRGAGLGGLGQSRCKAVFTTSSFGDGPRSESGAAKLRERSEKILAKKSQEALTMGWQSFWGHADVMFHLVEALEQFAEVGME